MLHNYFLESIKSPESRQYLIKAIQPTKIDKSCAQTQIHTLCLFWNLNSVLTTETMSQVVDKFFKKNDQMELLFSKIKNEISANLAGPNGLQSMTMLFQVRKIHFRINIFICAEFRLIWVFRVSLKNGLKLSSNTKSRTKIVVIA